MLGLLGAVRPAIALSFAAAAAAPFNVVSPIGGFRLDMLRDYVAIDIGFSPNEHKSRIKPVGHPLVEIAAVIGLEHARPEVLDRLNYRYGAWQGELAPLLARPALGGASPATACRSFVAQLGKPNKYARSIQAVTEEIPK